MYDMHNYLKNHTENDFYFVDHVIVYRN